MTRARDLLQLLPFAVLLGCSGAPPDDPIPPRCAQEWVIPPDSGVVVVDIDADPGGDGTRIAPLQTVDEGLALARASGNRYLLLAEGTYVGSLLIGADDVDLAVVGCGDDTILDAGGGIGIDVDGADGVILQDLVITGATVGVRVGGGAGAETAVEISGVTVREAVRLGVEIRGEGTRATLSDVVVDGVIADADDGDALGYGLLAWGAADVTGTDLVIRNATRTGVCFSALDAFALDRVTVEATAAFDGLLGRGVQLQGGAAGTVANLTVDGARDAGIFVLAADVALSDVVVSNTAESDVEGVPDVRAGAGLVVTSGDLVEPADAPFTVSVRASQRVDNARLGVLLEGFGLDVTLEQVVIEGQIIPDEPTLPATAPAFQTGAQVTVIDGEAAVELTGDDVQTFTRDPLPVE